MALTAICPNCNVENDPANVTCEVCKTSMGAMLVEPVGFRWFVASVAVALGLYAVLRILGVNAAVTLVIAIFYGPLIASYVARTNVVWSSALGGLAALGTVLFFTMIDGVRETKLRLGALVGHHGDGTPSAWKVLLAALVFLAALLPVSLIGASVGEHLSVRRRRRRPAS